MSSDPWASDDPQPGDFDVHLAMLDGQSLEHRDGDLTATVRILVSVEGKDAPQLERIADKRGRTPHDVEAELLRDADRPAE